MVSEVMRTAEELVKAKERIENIRGYLRNADAQVAELEAENERLRGELDRCYAIYPSLLKSRGKT